jgi:nucleotide-binding universal stress UspA family protein
MILTGYVPTPAGRAALERAIAEAALRGRGLLVVNASGGQAHVDPLLATSSDLEQVVVQAKDAGVQCEVRQVLGVNDVSDELLRFSQDTDVELLVIGVRHRSTVGKFLLGSTAQRLLLDAPCPVLAVKAE